MLINLRTEPFSGDKEAVVINPFAPETGCNKQERGPTGSYDTRLSSANPVSMFFKVFRQATSRTVHRIRHGKHLASSTAPGARARVLLIISAVDNLSSTDLDK